MEIMDSSRVMAPEDQLREAMIAAGIPTPPDEIIMDGSIRRFSTEPGNRGDSAGWYVAYGDGVPAGSFGDWRTGIKQDWYARLPRDLTIEERNQQEERVTQARKEREAYLKEKQLQAHIECTDIFDDAKPAPADHPYLVKKVIKPHTARISAHGDLILPLKVVTGHIVSLQYIQPDGTKRFHKGSSTKEGMEILGKMTQAHRIFICEGYATGATIYEKTGMPVIVAYSAGNLDTVARIMKVEVPDAEFMIVADNDESGVGQAKAAEAGAKNNMQVIIPPVVGDVNDYAQAGGDVNQLLTKKPTKGNLLTWISDIELKPPEWIIKDVLESESKIMLYGSTGAGKSFLAVDWACCVATGTAWNDQQVKKAGTVAYLASEGASGIKRRITAWEQTHNKRVENLLLSRGISLMEQTNDLIGDLTLLQVSPVLVIVDTLNAAMPGADENSNSDAAEIIGSINEIAQHFPSCTVMLVHHPGHTESARARGAYAWEAGMDANFRLDGSAGESQSKLTCTKMKEAEVPETPWVFEKTPVLLDGLCDEDGKTITSCVLTSVDGDGQGNRVSGLSRYAELVHEFLEAPDPIKKPQVGDKFSFSIEPIAKNWVTYSKAETLFENTGNSKNTFRKGLDELRKANQVEITYEKNYVISKIRLTPSAEEKKREEQEHLWVKELHAAWQCSGYHSSGNASRPYISEEGWIESINQRNPDFDTKQAELALTTPFEDTILDQLLDSKIICGYQEGYEVIDDSIAEQLRLLQKESKHQEKVSDKKDY